MRAVTAAGCLLIAMLTLPPAAARQADFSGTWVATKEAPASVPAAPSAVFGERFGIAMTERTVTLTRPIRGGSLVTEHPLDGSQVRSAVPGRQCMGDPATVATVARDGASLVYTLVSNNPAGGAPIAVGLGYLFRIEAPDTLVIETSMRTAQGESRRVGSVYKRSTEALPPALARPEIPGAPAAIKDVAWIAGDWEGGVGPSQLEERWTPAAGGAMLAINRTTRDGLTMSAFEFLCIAERHGSLVYTAMPNAGTPTDFTLTAFDENSATFENPAHDFPKKIRYAKRPDGGLEATISGAPGQRSTTFSFRRRAPG